MQSISRRGFVTSLGAVAGTLGVAGTVAAAEGTTAPAKGPKRTARIPFIHTTDLYNPPHDPDDHIDLATIYALEELDLRAIVLDPTRQFMKDRDPGFTPVAQMNYLTGRGVPVAAGPADLLRSVTDAADDRPRREQAGIELLLDALRQSPEPAVVSVVGSARVVAAAWNREPQLLKQKIRSVILNAGATTGKPAGEWNVTLDPKAWVALFRSSLPIEWYPCSGQGSAMALEPHNTFWRVDHRQLFGGLPRPLCAFFDYAFGHFSRGDIIRSLATLGAGPTWEKLLTYKRNMWSTPSFIAAADRVLAKTPDGWRFLPREQAAGLPLQLLEMLPIACQIDDDGTLHWSLKEDSRSRIRIFHRKADEEHVQALAEATNALLRQMPVG